MLYLEITTKKWWHKYDNSDNIQNDNIQNW